MNKLEVGMWVKTIFGEIGKIEKYCGTNSCGDLWKLDIKENAYNYKNILFSSYGLICLINIGDYVNGSKVIDKIEGKNLLILENKPKYVIDYDDIKSIVTKEQFESMKYKVGVNNE